MVKNSNNNWNEEELNANTVGSLKIGSNIVKSEFVDNFAKCWKNDMTLRQEGCELIKVPFKSAILQGLVSNEEVIITGLVDEMTKLKWTRKQMDLYEFHQSTDLANVESGLLCEFFKFLNNGED